VQYDLLTPVRTDLSGEIAMDPWMSEALLEARASFREGGAPVGAVLVQAGAVIGRGRNRLYQTGDPTTHAEMEAYRDAGRRFGGKDVPERMDALLAGCDIYTTAVPCEMCAGTILRFAGSRVVIGEAATYQLPDTVEFLRCRGIEVTVLGEPECISLVEQYLRRFPKRRPQWVALPHQVSRG
jgi:creatinine deaminase